MYRACHASGISISRVEVEQKHARLHCCLTSSNGMMAGGAESHTPRRYSRWHVTLAENQQSFSNLGFWFTAKQFYLMLFFPWFLPPSICENYTVLPIWPLHICVSGTTFPITITPMFLQRKTTNIPQTSYAVHMIHFNLVPDALPANLGVEMLNHTRNNIHSDM